MARPTNNEFILSVSQYLDAINLAIESSSNYEIQGEVTDFKQGKWISFTLKDPEDGSLLKCVMGEWTWRRIGIELEDGMLVKITGNPKVNKKYGSFGMWVETIEPLGEGSLKKAYELLLKRLREEGLFDRKRPLPEFVERIGVVSSRHGVVIHDFMKNLDARGFRVKFVDTRVEGDGAVEGILVAIRELQREEHALDIIIVMRGGGSLESMQAFNNEQVARAVFASRVPVIAGIGHDVDVPIATMVADASASTPTATAHLVNRSWTPLTETLPLRERELLHTFERVLAKTKHGLALATQHMTAGLERIFAGFRNLEAGLLRGLRTLEAEHCNTRELVRRGVSNLVASYTVLLRQGNEGLTRSEQYLAAVNPERNLCLGYSIVRSQGGKVVKSVRDVSSGDYMTTQVVDGSIESNIYNIKNA